MKTRDDVLRHADRFAALGHEARLAIVRLLLSAHPAGLVVGEIQQELGIPSSTLSHHLDTLRQHGLVAPVREKKFLRYRASTDAFRDLLGFLYGECCTRNAVVPVDDLTIPVRRPSRVRTRR